MKTTTVEPLTPRARDTRTTRASLLHRIRSLDDEASWTEFYGIYRAFIENLARRHGLSEYRVKEVLQNTMINVAEKAAEFEYDPKKSFRGWLAVIAFRRSVDELKKEQAFAQLSLAKLFATGQEPSDEGMSQGEQIAQAEWEESILQAVNEELRRTSSSAHFQIYHLLIVTGMPFDEVTGLLKVSAAHIYLVKFRMVKKAERIGTRLIKSLPPCPSQ